MGATRNPRSQSQAPVIVWFRDDLRLTDNPALRAAAATGQPLRCVFILDEASDGLRPLGGAARWWLHGALAALNQALASAGGGLQLMRGPATELVPRLALECGASAVFWNRRYGATERRIDAAVKTDLRALDIAASSFNGHLLYEPWTVTSREGGPYRVFSAFWRAAGKLGPPPSPQPAPSGLAFEQSGTTRAADALALADLQLQPTAPDWAGGLRQAWTPGEEGAQRCLEQFVETAMPAYAGSRDRPDLASTSRLSPHLRFGGLSPRQVWHAAAAAEAARSGVQAYRSFEKFQAELGWREFCYHLLYQHPDLASRNLQGKFDRMPWRRDAAALQAWQCGRTGYPLVDAGMRQLWATGWMHNRVRMVVASFLVKHLLIDWREGEAWFWDTLVDADPANNPASWQWVAGCGADAAPYFRIFNPVLQGEKFDPQGAYVKHWIPELAQLPAAIVHKPWDAAPEKLRTAGVELGENYPQRVVEHQHARERALAALGVTGGGSAGQVESR